MPRKRKKDVTIRDHLRSLYRVGRVAFSIAPSVAWLSLLDSIISALSPIILTYFAALTTSSLAEAYTGIPGADDDAIRYVIITAAIGIVMLVWAIIYDYIRQLSRYKIEATVEDQMIEQFASLPFHMYDDKDVIDMHEKARRFSYVFSHIFQTIGSMITAVFGVLGSIIALMLFNVWLGLIVLAAAVPGIAIQLRLSRKQIAHWNENITDRRRQNNIKWQLSDNQYIAQMRLHGVIKHLINVHSRLRAKDEKVRIMLELKTTRQRLAADILEAVVELGALLWIVFQIIDRMQPVGQFVFVQQLVGRALSSSRSLASQLGSADEDLANLTDYQKFIDIPRADGSGDVISSAPDVVRVDSVSFAYPKTEREILSDISVVIKRGEKVAFAGENGAGKSTLIKLLMGLYVPEKGGIFVDGMQLRDINQQSWHQLIAYLGQDFVSYWFATIEENIRLGDVQKHDPIDTAIRRAQFGDVVAKLKHGTSTYIERWMALPGKDDTATELSGGQRQRLAMARNFYRDSPIVILDEPTSAIDALAEAKIFDQLFRDKDKTIITISHRLSTIRKADVVYMMQDGKIVESGTADELIAQKGVFHRMFESQI